MDPNCSYYPTGGCLILPLTFMLHSLQIKTKPEKIRQKFIHTLQKTCVNLSNIASNLDCKAKYYFSLLLSRKIHRYMFFIAYNTINTVADWFLWLWDTPFARPLCIILLSMIVGFLLRWTAKKWLLHIAQRSADLRDDILLEALRRSIFYIIVLIGINVAVRELPVSIRTVLLPYSRPTINTGIIVLVTFLFAQILRQIFKSRAANESSKIAAVSLTRRIVEIVIYSVGAIMILRTFGVDVTAIITALGVGGLAVALALQDTLANAFAGVYITLAKQIRVGDYIKTNDGFEGFVRDIGWRNTTIELLERSFVLIPNNKLAQAIVTNYFLPTEILYAKLTIGVSYQHDPAEIEKILHATVTECGSATAEEANTVEQPPGKIRGIMTQPEPLVRFQAFGEYALQFTLFFSVNTFDNQFSARHELMKRIYTVFRQRGIVIPLPIHTVRLDTYNEQQYPLKPTQKG